MRAGPKCVVLDEHRADVAPIHRFFLNPGRPLVAYVVFDFGVGFNPPPNRCYRRHHILS